MKAVALVFGIGWLVFWIYWLLAAIGSRSGSGSQWGRYAGFRIALIVVIFAVLRGNAFHGHAVTDSPLLWAIGLALFAAGLAFAVWARVYIGTNWGMPMNRKDDPELVTSGPYSRVRHPIYSGIILALIGTSVALSVYWLIPAAVIGAYFVFSATREEQYMTQRFPDSYPAYKQSTKMLVPYIF
jgi:protein-S-isoprenylcysteine O-methyltransferase Ste14